MEIWQDPASVTNTVAVAVAVAVAVGVFVSLLFRTLSLSLSSLPLLAQSQKRHCCGAGPDCRPANAPGIDNFNEFPALLMWPPCSSSSSSSSIQPRKVTLIPHSPNGIQPQSNLAQERGQTEGLNKRLIMCLKFLT